MRNYTIRSKTRAVLRTKKQFRRGGGQGKSKPAPQTVETPSNATKRLVKNALSASEQFRRAQQTTLKLVREKKDLTERTVPRLQDKITSLEESIKRKTDRESRLSEESKEQLDKDRAKLASFTTELAAHRKRLTNINATFGEQTEAGESAAAGVSSALQGIEGVGEHQAHVLEQRAAAAAAASAAANKTQANLLYAALPNNAARGRFLTAQRKAEEFASGKTTEAIINKYKTSIQQITKIANTMKKQGINKPRHNALDEQFEYLNTFTVRLYEILGERANINAKNYVALGSYNTTNVNLNTVPNYTSE
jgi:hypothetical protein